MISVIYLTKHVPLLWHGPILHSSISVSQFIPVYPVKQEQLYPPMSSVWEQLAPLRQGIWWAHGNISVRKGSYGWRIIGWLAQT